LTSVIVGVVAKKKLNQLFSINRNQLFFECIFLNGVANELKHYNALAVDMDMCWKWSNELKRLLVFHIIRALCICSFFCKKALQSNAFQSCTACGEVERAREGLKQERFNLIKIFALSNFAWLWIEGIWKNAKYFAFLRDDDVNVRWDY
jgi:hypothetical protein